MFRQAVALSPQDFRYQGFLAETIELQQVPGREDARAHYEEAIRLGYGLLTINPEHHETRSAVASYLAQLGLRSEAMRELEMLKGLDRTDMVVQRNIAMAWLLLGDYDLAVRHFTAAVAHGHPVFLLVQDPRLEVLASREDFRALLDGAPTTTTR